MQGRDALNLTRILSELSHMFDSTISFVSRTRTSTGTQDVAYGFDNAPYNVWSEDKGYTESEEVVEVPCRIVPSITEDKNLTQVGYMPNSAVEVEVLAMDLDRFGLDWNTLERDYDYVKLRSKSLVSRDGRSISTGAERWDITSVRTLGFGDEIMFVRIGLRRREVDES